jgi:hypothetical protein
MDAHTLQRALGQRLAIVPESTLMAGLNWYPKAHKFCADLARKYDTSIETVAGVVAAISPQKQWDVNMRLAEQALDAFTKHAAIPRVNTPVQMRKVFKILKNLDPLDVLRGPKESCFYLNLAGLDPNAVTIDRHIWALVKEIVKEQTGIEWRSLTSKRHGIITEAFKSLAAEHNLPGCGLQGILWEDWKATKKEG